MHETPATPRAPHAVRRRLVHGAAWLLATGAAVTLSWWGVHTVMAGTVYDPPQALPVAATEDEPTATPPVSSSTHRPTPSPATKSPSPTHTKPTSLTPRPSTTPPPSPTSGSDSGSGSVKSYATSGGRAVFDLKKTSATLVSATPAAGWSVQVWKQPTWIRVEFTKANQKVSAFCTWHDHEPTVEIAKY
ncbi:MULTISPECIES: hypothetical protein [unclassified Streptomyces]|uniref:hypothetical protein n=1 Tax=unclassified Streptomyces TaxID=2593676 RepID=UPI00278C7608|nr:MULTISPECIES: hypothetical protein [unclassified Streptomyces]